MAVCVQLYPPATIPVRKNPWNLSDRKLGEPQRNPDGLAKRKLSASVIN